jgi:hypothetical protein
LLPVSVATSPGYATLDRQPTGSSGLLDPATTFPHDHYQRDCCLPACGDFGRSDLRSDRESVGFIVVIEALRSGDRICCDIEPLRPLSKSILTPNYACRNKRPHSKAEPYPALSRTLSWV